MDSLSLVHLRPVVVAEQVKERMHERRGPVLADDVRADDRIAELPREESLTMTASVPRLWFEGESGMQTGATPSHATRDVAPPSPASSAPARPATW